MNSKPPRPGPSGARRAHRRNAAPRGAGGIKQNRPPRRHPAGRPRTHGRVRGFGPGRANHQAASAARGVSSYATQSRIEA